MFVLLVNSKRHFDNTAEKLKCLHDSVNSNLHMYVRNILQSPHPPPPAKKFSKSKNKTEWHNNRLIFQYEQPNIQNYVEFNKKKTDTYI